MHGVKVVGPRATEASRSVTIRSSIEHAASRESPAVPSAGSTSTASGPLRPAAMRARERLIGHEIAEAAAAHRLHVDEDVLAGVVLADQEAVAAQAIEPFDPHRLERPGVAEQARRIDPVGMAGMRRGRAPAPPPC